jgi:hypothetical protein
MVPELDDVIDTQEPLGAELHGVQKLPPNNDSVVKVINKYTVY